MMELYILRHAIAVPRGTPGYPNDDRPLTDEGVRKMMENAKGIARLVPGFDVILTSPLIRARDTARITAEALNCVKKIRVSPELLPEKSLDGVLSVLARNRRRHRVLLVGHEPGLSELACRLIGAGSAVIEFKKGALCRIDLNQVPPGIPGLLRWYLAPKQLRMIAK
jgi:phosphohistidine phosphatase